MKRKTILVIDDIIPCLTMTKQILEDYYDVYLAKSINSSMVILKIARIDLILLDIEMPDMSGLDFIGFLRNTPKYREIPVIFVSSHGTKHMFLKAMDSGAKDFLVKPVSSEILLDKVDTAFKFKNAEGIDRDQLTKGLLTLSNIHR